jgi:hypothetical protein
MSRCTKKVLWSLITYLQPDAPKVKNCEVTPSYDIS